MTKYNDLINKTGKRKASFDLMIQSILSKTNPLIIETGCVRDINNISGDGVSTLIFDAFALEHGAEFYSVDISDKNVNLAIQNTSKARISCQDSVVFLYELNKVLRDSTKYIDLLYLDSFDAHPHVKHQSSLHHLKELVAIWPSCKEGTIIAVDDNFEDGTGKGTYVKSFFDDLGIKPIFNGYQIVWKI